MFAIPQFYSRLKKVTGPALSALKYRLISIRSRTRGSDRQNLGSNESSEVLPYVKTEVLGSVQGYVNPPTISAWGKIADRGKKEMVDL